MPEYNTAPVIINKHNGLQVASFIKQSNKENADKETINAFGSEWTRFNYFSADEIEKIGDTYFDIVDKKMINQETIALDIGCGSGRWSKYLSKKVKFIEAIDPSEAVFSAAMLTKDCGNVRVSRATIDQIPFPPFSFDFAFSLGVLHHIPDTQKALNKAVEYLKPGAYFLIYLYYKLDNRGLFYRLLFKLAHGFRYIISKLPARIKYMICDIIAYIIYLPFIAIASLIKLLFPQRSWYKRFPLSYYIGKSMKIIRNDSLDRFGTPLEQRFTKEELLAMMGKAGLTDIIVSDKEPYWHAVGKKR